MEDKMKKNSTTNKTKQIAKEFMKPLSGKQKRTTICLTKQGEDSLGWIKKHSKRKINSIIDNLCNNFIDEKNETAHILIEAIIENAKNSNSKSKDRIRRSVVLSDRSLKILNDTAKKYQIPRDSIIDSGFYMLSQLLKHNNETRLENHKEALNKINKLWSNMNNIEKELNILLEEDDPILEGLGYAITHIMNLSIKIKAELKDGTPIDLEA